MVEILKIGTVLKTIVDSVDKPTILVVCNGGPIFDYYVSILKEKCLEDYIFLNTDKAIVGDPPSYRLTKGKLTGIPDAKPTVGQAFTINGFSWHTSKVIRIVEENILITQNSVYAIHNLSEIRDKKLNDIGIK